MLLTLPNFISLARFPLALVFLSENISFRVTGLILAMLTDFLDGFLARRYQKSSRLGTFLDPAADKFFALFVLSIFIQENRIELWQVVTMLGRDFSVAFFGLYLAAKGTLVTYRFRSIQSGKVTTTLQFLVLLGLIFNVDFPPFVFISFIILGIGALLELSLSYRQEAC